MNVDQATMTQPTAWTIHIAADHGGPTCHITAGTGCHHPNRANSSRLAVRTKVARSAGAGISRIRRRLTPARAITECCTAKASNSAASMTSATQAGLVAAPSMEVGAPRSARNPIAQPTLSRKAPYAITAYPGTARREVMLGVELTWLSSRRRTPGAGREIPQFGPPVATYQAAICARDR